jgi:hypothetical protein
MKMGKDEARVLKIAVLIILAEAALVVSVMCFAFWGTSHAVP